MRFYFFTPKKSPFATDAIKGLTTNNSVAAVMPAQTKYKKHSSGSWNQNTNFKVKGGQAIKFEVKNVNVLGTTITIETNHGTKSQIILPLSTATFEFTVFGTEPTPWTIDISSESDAFIVAWTLYSTWVPGDPTNGK